MTPEQSFLRNLAGAIIEAGGAWQHDPENAMALASQTADELRKMGPFCYPNLIELGEIRFVYQWDETPPIVVVMVWDDHMWRDIAKVEVPDGVLD